MRGPRFEVFTDACTHASIYRSLRAGMANKHWMDGSRLDLRKRGVLKASLFLFGVYGFRSFFTELSLLCFLFLLT